MARKIEFKGYTIVQSDYNHHVLIADEEGRIMMHASCTLRMSDKELREMVERYISFIESSDIMQLLAESEEEE